MDLSLGTPRHGGSKRNSLRVGGSSRRHGRLVTPYGEARPSSAQASVQSPSTSPGAAAIKFLLPNAFIGSLIGPGGASIRELCEISGAVVQASESDHFYPGTFERVVYLSGSVNQVNYAQSLIWEMIGQQTHAENHGLKGVKFSPSAVHPLNSGTAGKYDDMHVKAKLAVPSSMGGHIVGRAGSSLRTLSTESGATISIDSKEDADALQTYERIVTLEGSVAMCMKCTDLILNRIVGVEGGCQYTYSTNYSRPNSLTSANFPLHSKTSGRTIVRGDLHSHSGISTGGVGGGAEVLSAYTNIEIAVPDHLVGVILGVHGATLSEIIQLSGATVIVSKRGEFVEGTTNRLVTVVGSPVNAQTAHTLIQSKLRQAQEE